MTRKITSTPAERKLAASTAHDIVGYDAQSCPLIAGKTKLEILDLIDQLADAGDFVTVKEVTLEFRKRLTQGQLYFSQLKKK